MDITTILALVGVLVVIVIATVIIILKKKSQPSKAAETKDYKDKSGIDKQTSKAVAKADSGSDEEFLISLDLGSKLTAKISEQLASDKSLTLNKALTDLLPPETKDNSQENIKKPHTIVFVGVNGVGKTTTLGKIANLFAQQGKNVVLAAADTFRAGAADQLEVWGKRAAGNGKKGKVEVVRGEVSAAGNPADPASVAFKAAELAVSTETDYLLIDTAGRQQTNTNLMEELGKIKRVVEKQTTVDDVYLVVDGTAGQTSLQQAQKFHEVTEITGIVVTKLDGSTKGGAVFLVSYELEVPVKYIGTGEGLEDLEEFNVQNYVNNLLKNRR
jgi:fused signal recognition particle receptor